MPTYEVTVVCEVEHTITVDAFDHDEARREARTEFVDNCMRYIDKYDVEVVHTHEVGP